MTAPLFGPSATVTSRVFGNLDGSSFSVAAWITSSPFLTVYLPPSKVIVTSLNSAAGTSFPPALTDSNVQVPWNFLSSLIGRWEDTDPPKGGSYTIEFFKDGSVTIIGMYPGVDLRADGTYKVDGNKITMKLDSGTKFEMV